MKLRDLCQRADLAIRLGHPDYAAAVCRHLLKSFPGLVQARCLYAQALLDGNMLEEAASEFRVALELDPENPLAHSGLGVIALRHGDLKRAIERFERALELKPGDAVVRDSLLELYGQQDRTLEPKEQVAPRLALARWRLRRQEHSLALRECDWLLARQSERAEVHLLRAEVLWRSGRETEAERGCQEILERWPRCLKARLMMGELLSRDPEREGRGVAMLHEALGADPTGSVACSLFRNSGFELPLLGDQVSLPAPDGDALPAPPELESALALLPGLAPGDAVEPEWSPPQGMDLEAPPLAAPAPPVLPPDPAIIAVGELGGERDGPEERPRRRARRPERRESLHVVQLIVSSRRRLLQRYGEAGVGRLEGRLRDYGAALAASGVEAKLVYLDDEASLAPFGLEPTDTEDPGQIKALIDSLDQLVCEPEQEPPSVLILGGDAIVPFWRLENPSEDDDGEVLSDSPYASRSEGYLLPQRSLGRLPDAADADLDLLLRQLDTALLRRHQAPPGTGLLGWLDSVRRLAGLGTSMPSSLGCSAGAWRDASVAAFSAVGGPARLQISPPATVLDMEKAWQTGATAAYFSLRGARDAAQWYGQPGDTPPHADLMLPAAFGPELAERVDAAGSVVFTEASHGAYLLDKTRQTSIPLRFLAKGALGVVGPTATAYGSVTSDLAGANLLAFHFWRRLLEGMSLGQALGHAKHDVYADALRRQGWLDGDDQKALLQFTLFGDPSLRFRAGVSRGTGLSLAGRQHSGIPQAALCRRFRSAHAQRDLSPEVVRRAVGHLQQRAAGGCGPSFRVVRQGGCQSLCSDCAWGMPKSARRSPSRGPVWSFTTSRLLSTSEGARLRCYAHVTLDAEGGIAKTVVSR
mgnify:CR=1 FL=1